MASTPQLTEIKGHTHDYYGSAGDINKDVWAFLKEHTLAADPKFQQVSARSRVIRGASPLGLPYTRPRSPLRRLPPGAWLARCRSLATATDGL